MIRGFWSCGTNCIVDVRITDLDSKSYLKKSSNKVLAGQEQEKKRKYLEACLEQQQHFTPFVCSTDGLLGREAHTFAKRLSAKLANIWQHPYSQVCGYVNARLSIAIVCATPVPTRQPYPGQPHQHKAPPVGGWCWLGTL